MEKKEEKSEQKQPNSNSLPRSRGSLFFSPRCLRASFAALLRQAVYSGECCRFINSKPQDMKAKKGFDVWTLKSLVEKRDEPLDHELSNRLEWSVLNIKMHVPVLINVFLHARVEFTNFQSIKSVSYPGFKFLIWNRKDHFGLKYWQINVIISYLCLVANWYFTLL